MQEYSVKDDSIGRAIRIFESIKKSNKFKNDELFEKELQLLKYELQLLENSEDGTKLLYSDTTTKYGLVQKTEQIGHQCRFNSDTHVVLNRTVMSEMIRTF
jgi:hypothetical protein